MSDMNFASLSPTLLARKGGAKPAMRRQSPMIAGPAEGVNAIETASPEALEDLGWNDLGDSQEDATQASNDAPLASRAAARHANDAPAPGENERDAKEDFAPLGRHAHSTANPADKTVSKAAEPEQEPESPAPQSSAPEDFENVTAIRKGAPRLPRPRPVETARTEPKTKRTAFTLRLDQDRHLKLRMACTLAGRSAQALVTEALDAMLADIPELDQLVARVQSRPTREG